MRDIKFRGKREYNKKWIYGNLIQNEQGKYIVPFDDIELDGHHIQYGSDEPVFMLEETIGQYTGFKDKNGTEIYEFDIIINSYNQTLIVTYWDKLGEWVFVKKLENINKSGNGNLCSNKLRPDNIIEEIEVIGNIFDHSELL